MSDGYGFRWRVCLIPVLILCVILAGCSTACRQYLHPDYQEKQSHTITLLVMPVTTEFLSAEKRRELIGNQFHLNMDMNEMEKRYYNAFFGTALAEAAQAEVMGVDPYFKPEDMTFAYENLQLPDQSIVAMFVPVKGMVVYRDDIPRFVLFVEDLFFDKQHREERGGRGFEGEVYETNVNMEYLIWDNTREKVAGYGQLAKKIKLLGPPGRSNYLDIFEEFSRMIVAKSPFLGRKMSLRQ